MYVAMVLFEDTVRSPLEIVDCTLQPEKVSTLRIELDFFSQTFYILQRKKNIFFFICEMVQISKFNSNCRFSAPSFWQYYR